MKTEILEKMAIVVENWINNNQEATKGILADCNSYYNSPVESLYREKEGYMWSNYDKKWEVGYGKVRQLELSLDEVNELLVMLSDRWSLGDVYAEYQNDCMFAEGIDDDDSAVNDFYENFDYVGSFDIVCAEILFLDEVWDLVINCDPRYVREQLIDLILA